MAAPLSVIKLRGNPRIIKASNRPCCSTSEVSWKYHWIWQHNFQPPAVCLYENPDAKARAHEKLRSFWLLSAPDAFLPVSAHWSCCGVISFYTNPSLSFACGHWHTMADCRVPASPQLKPAGCQYGADNFNGGSCSTVQKVQFCCQGLNGVFDLDLQRDRFRSMLCNTNAQW